MMIQTKLRTQNPFFYSKCETQRIRAKKEAQNTESLLKKDKLINLREICPQKLMEDDIFSENFVRSPKLGLKNKKQKQMEVPGLISLKYYMQRKKTNSKYSNRKQSENNVNVQPSTKIQNHAPETQRYNISNNYTQQKSGISTKADSQEFEKENTQADFFNDDKNIIKLKTLENRIQQQISENKQTSIQDFEILSFCGEGVFGSVYIAKHKKTNMIFALKKIAKTKINDQKDKESLIREIKIHLKLNHSNIIKFYGCFSSDKEIYFILELCKSGNLYEMLQQHGNFEEKQVKDIIRQVCKGLEYLHNKNIIHRDIKAQNIVLHQKIVKICDFGWASQGQYSRKSLCGTPAYISPQIVQNKLYDKKVDVWSMGILTFELVFGKIPFDIKCPDDFQKIVEEQLLFPQETSISECCRDFLLRCLQKDSYKRWDTARLLNHPFLKRE